MHANVEELATRLAPPWYTFQRKIVALLGEDPQVHIRDLAQTEGDYTLPIMVENAEKAAALKTILQPTVDFGGVVLTTIVLGPDEDAVASFEGSADLYTDAFAGNPLFVEAMTITYPGFATMTYCVFAAAILQFWNDDLSDYRGNCTALPAEIARDILAPDTVQYCTEQI